MKFNEFLSVLIGILFCVLGLGYSENAMSKTLKIYTGEDVHAPYDFKIETSILGTVNPVLYGYLLKANETQELSPGLITKWNYDYKNNLYRLTLGSEKFHNGREISSVDLEFSIIRGFISKTENYNRIHFSDILGIDQLQPGMKFHSGMVRGIRVIDEKNLEISLKAVKPIFLLNFTIPFVPLVPREELKDDYYTWKSMPVGAGPYRILKDYSDHVLVLKAVHKSPDWVPELIEYHTTRMPVEYDIVFDRVNANDKEKSFKKAFSKHPASINSIFFYRGNALNENVNFRKAVYHAINREAVVAGSEQFKPAYEMMVRPYAGSIEPKNPYNLDLAKKYINKVPSELLQKKITIGVYSPDKEFTSIMRDRIKVMSKDLDQLGLTLSFEPNPEKFPTPGVMKKYSMKLWSKVVDLADPSISFGAMSSISPYKNEMPDSHGKFDELYQKAEQASTFEDRLKGIQAIAHLIEEEALVVPIMQKYVLYRYNTETVESLGEQSKPLFMDVSLVKMK